MKMPKIEALAAGTDLPEPWCTSRTLKMLPCVNDFLCNPNWEEGTARGERSLMVFHRSGSVTMILKVERPPLKLVVSGPSFDEALAALEASLGLPTCPFQHDDNPLGKDRKKKR